jgi:hypothetical protein
VNRLRKFCEKSHFDIEMSGVSCSFQNMWENACKKKLFQNCPKSHMGFFIVNREMS